MTWERDGAKRLRRAMALRDETVESLSKRSGVSESAIRSWLSGEAVPTVSNLERVCRAMAIGIDWLVRLP